MSVNTDTSIEAHCHPGHTLTAERPLGVHTVAVHAHPRSLTLINVYTHAPARVQQISRFTDAFKAPIFVYAQSIQAHVSDQTLVLILTVFAICRDFKSGVTDTVEAALGVDTAAVVADTTICHALIQISALGPGCSRLKPSGALTDIRARRVDTFSMSARVPLTFISIDALSSSIQVVAHVALAAVADAGQGDTPAVQTQVAKGLAHVCDVLGLDNRRTWRRL